jgi:UDP-glucose 4-epimerase
LKRRKVLVTGGCGFIGSHVVDALADAGIDCIAFDNMSEGREDNIGSMGSGCVKVVRGDITDVSEITSAIGSCDAVVHAAANPDVQRSMSDPSFDRTQNVEGTRNVLEAMGKEGTGKIVFLSSSTVYGNAHIPTSEIASIAPISNYGRSKADAETLISDFSKCPESSGRSASIMRLANIIGPRSRHGVVYDFYKKLKSDPNRLRILGDGRQSKSYLDVSDCVDAVMMMLSRNAGGCEVVNVGSEGQIDVDAIARIVCEEMGLGDVRYEYTGGTGGWRGDVPIMMLDVSRMKGFGWKPKVGMEESVRNYLGWLSNADKDGVL